ncbi:MAG: hypothetical protein WCK49_01905 [Myxococcaceae bacterium]
MKKNIFAVLFCFIFVTSLSAYNITEAKKAAAVAGGQILTSLLFLDRNQFEPKFSAQFGIGLHDPVVSVSSLWLQDRYLGDKTAHSSALTLVNRIVAQQVAQEFNTTESMGYLVAAAMNIGGIWRLSEGPVKTALIDYKLWGALANMVEQRFLEAAFTPAVAQLGTGIVTGGLSLSLASRNDVSHIRNAFVIESGIRVLPGILGIWAPAGFVQHATNLALGIPVIAFGKSMQQGAKKEFVMATGMSFGISSVYTLMSVLLQKIEN